MDIERALVLFGKRLQTLRKNKGLKQDELAEKANLSSWEQISKIERGVSGTNIRTIIVLANALEAKPAELFDFSLEDIKERKKADAAKKLLEFVLQQDEVFIRFVYEQAKTAATHWKK